MSYDQTFEDFDPNKLTPGKPPIYGVYKDGTFLAKPSRGPAIASFNTARRAKLYKMTSTGWVLLTVKRAERSGALCQICGQATRSRYISQGSAPVGKWDWEREPGNKISDPPVAVFMCTPCISERRYG